LRHGESYRIGFFLVGAYQEILGDIHNLFGDTDAIEVSLDGDGYAIVQQRRGDTTDVMLDYVGYAIDDLRRAYRDKVAAADLPARQRLAHRHHLEAVDVQVRRQVGDPPHRLGDVVGGDGLRARVERVRRGLVAAGAHQGELGLRQSRLDRGHAHAGAVQ